MFDFFEELKEYIFIAPNLDEMTATKYANIQREAYTKGRAEEQQRAEYIIYKNYIPKQEIKDIVFGSIHKGTVFKDEYIYPSDTCQYVVRRIVKELLQEEDK